LVHLKNKIKNEDEDEYSSQIKVKSVILQFKMTQSMNGTSEKVLTP